MVVDLIRIGNSKGFRIPAFILKQCSIGDKLDLTVEDGKIILRPTKIPREGWRESFKTMHENGDDNILIDDIVDISEDWEWK